MIILEKSNRVYKIIALLNAPEWANDRAKLWN